MQHTLPGSSITKIGQHHVICSAVLFRKSQPGTCTDLGTYNSMSTIKILFLTKKVHASTLSFCTSRGLAIQFSHTGINGYSFSYSQPMIAVSGNEHVFRFSGSHASGSYSFLPHIGMKE